MRVAVIQAGPSAEAEVSRRSAAGVAAALIQAGHQAVTIDLSASLMHDCSSGGFDVVFPATHGRLGEDGCLQGMLEIMGVPYVGSGVLASALAFDKVAAKCVLRAAGLRMAPDVVVRAGCDLPAVVRHVRGKLGRGVVAKPAAQGSAIGVQRVQESEGDDVLREAIERAFAYGDTVLCEQFVHGREITCGVIDLPETGGPQAFPVTEIFSKAADWYDFASRYAQGGSVHQCPASLEPALVKQIQQVACAAHAALGCRDLSRVDFITPSDRSSGESILLEVNTLPGMTSTSLYPEAAAVFGLSFDRVCDALVRAAVARASSERPIAPVPIP